MRQRDWSIVADALNEHWPDRRAAARALGLSPNSMRKYIDMARGHGFVVMAAQPGPRSPRWWPELVEAVNAAPSRVEAARRLGLSVDTVRTYAAQARRLGYRVRWLGKYDEGTRGHLAIRDIMLDKLTHPTRAGELFNSVWDDFGSVSERTLWRHLNWLVDNSKVIVTGARYCGDRRYQRASQKQTSRRARAEFAASSC